MEDPSTGQSVPTGEGSLAALPARRRADLARFIRERGQATVTELAAAFDVSVDTVRRDLEYLADRRAVVRTHGGAVATGELTTASTPLMNRISVNREAKERIGAAAAALISDGQTVLVNGGTTTLATVRALRHRRDLTLVTNNLLVPSEVPRAAVRDLYMLGGSCNIPLMVNIGPVGFPGMGGVSADAAVIGVGGVSAAGGLSTTNLPEAQMMRQMIDSSVDVIVVSDSSKFGRNAFVHICGLDAASTLVTDVAPTGDLAEALAAAQVEIIVA